MTIYKHTLRVTILSKHEELPDRDLDALWEECTDGEFIGDWKQTSVLALSEEDAKDELIAIGNDGTFFDPL